MMRIVPAGLACLLLAACSTTELGSAASLAGAGKQTATDTATYLAEPAKQTEVFYEGLVLASAFPSPSAANPKACNAYGLTPPDDAFQAEVDDYLSAIAKTRAFFSRLAKVYDAFGALASYDASGVVEKSINDLSAAGNDFAAKVGGPTVPANVGGLISSIGGMAAQDVQKRKVKKASELIRVRLEAYARAMRARPGLFTNVRQEQVRKGYQVAETLWCAGIMDARPMLKSIASGYDMDLPGGQAAVTSKDEAIASAVKGVLKFRSTRDQQGIDAEFADILDGLDALVVQHAKLEEGAPVDLDALAARTAALRKLIETAAKD